MRVYLVGGAVRDRLLGLPVRERDWVVTGATPEEMRGLGYTPVDGTFPVFRHPQTNDEYALARVETKRGSGHRGFSFHCGPDVSLEQDLARRDLSVNAIAEDGEGRLIDPFAGVVALHERRLVHITPAFADDPLRLLRAARFAATLAHLGFTIHDSTLVLMRQMTTGGEHALLSRERIWREISLALQSPTPRVVFDVLRDCGAAPGLLPSLPTDALTRESRPMRVLQSAAAVTEDAEVRFAAFIATLTDGADRDTAESIARGVASSATVLRTVSRVVAIASALESNAERTADYWLKAVEAGDGLRQTAEFRRVLPAVETIRDEHPGSGQLARTLLTVQAAAAGVDTAKLAATGVRGARFGEALREARLRAVALQLKPSSGSPNG